MTTPRLFTLLWAVVIFGLPILAISYEASFSRGCRPWSGQLYGQDKIGFFCYTSKVAQYDYKYTLINLGHCVGNNASQLVDYRNGNYQKTCKKCVLIPDSTGQDPTSFLQCECPDAHGDMKKSKLDLSEVLENDNGRLYCHGYYGTSEQSPPKCFRNQACSSGVQRLTPRAQPTSMQTSYMA